MSNHKPVPEITDISRHFWEAVQRDELCLQRCLACSAWIYYPNRRCTSCYSDELEWQTCSGRGSVWSYSVVHQAPYESYRVDVPYILAMVRLEEGPQMMTNLLNCDPGELEIGLPVVFTTETRSDGFKIPQFQPSALR